MILTAKHAGSAKEDQKRIEMLENEKGIFFESGNAVPTDVGKEMILLLSKELGGPPDLPPPPPLSESDPADPIEQLRKLGELRDASSPLSISRPGAKNCSGVSDSLVRACDGPIPAHGVLTHRAL